MLQRIRDGASGPLAYIVVAVITVVFGVWGIGSYFTPSSDPVVASAGGTDITHSQLQQLTGRRYAQLRQAMGQRFNSDLLSRDEIRRNVLDGLIDQAVVTQYARNAGYRVTDADLLAQIRDNPQFQNNGEFSSVRYKAVLGQAGFAPAQYEARLRQSLLGGQVQQIVASTAFAVPPEVDAAYRLAYEQRQVGVLSFAPSAFAGRVSLDDGAIRGYYENHPKQFMRPPRVKLAYVSLEAGQIAPGTPDQKTLRKLYKTHKHEFGTPAKRSADIIRIPVDANNDSKARTTVQSVHKAAKGGQPLKKIAANTPGAHYQTIDGQAQSALGDALGSALFGLKSGGLSNPVRGDNAWYVLRLTGTAPANTPKFSDPAVQSRLKTMARRQAIAKAFKAKADKLDDLAYQAPNSLKTISDKLGLKIQQSGWITPNGGDKGIGQYKAVDKAAFSDAVVKDKLNSEVLDLGGQRRVVLRVTEHQGPQRKPLAAVRQVIHDRLVHQKAAKLAQQAAEQAADRARRGQSLSALASGQKGVVFKQLGYIERSDGNLDSRIVRAAFGAPISNQSKKPKYQVVSIANGKVALVAVTGSRVKNSGSSQKTDAQRRQLAQSQSNDNARLEYRALNRYLRHQADVKIHKNALN